MKKRRVEMKKSKGNFMNNFATFVVKFRWIFLGIFIALTAVCCYTTFINKVNYNLAEYLPAESTNTKALTLLKKEFDDKGMIYLMIKNVEESEIATIQAELSEIKGVGAVVFDPTTGYNDNKALFLTITFTDYDATQEAYDTTNRLLDYIEDKDAYITGQSAYTYYTRAETESSITKLGAVIVIVILVMLIFTSKSFFELVPMLLVFAISVVLNLGTNFLFGGISYVSNLVSLILQLALSLDYAVIFVHRFMEERDLAPDAQTAAIEALKKGTPEILSSSFTTIAGLVSLLLMSLPIGVEIGISLAKSIVCSLVTVIFVMPALFVLCGKPLQKSRHKSFVPKITRPAKALLKARYVIVPLFIVIIILSAVGQSFNVYSFNMNGGAMVVEPKAEITKEFGPINEFVVVVPKGDYEKERALANKIMQYDIVDKCNALSTIQIAEGVYLTDEMGKEDFAPLLSGLMGGSVDGAMEGIITSAINKIFDDCATAYYPDQNPDTLKIPLVDLIQFVAETLEEGGTLGGLSIPQEYTAMLSQLTMARSQLESENYSRLTFNLTSEVEGEDTFAFLDDMDKVLGEFYEEFYYTGESVVCYDMALVFPHDNMVVSICIICFVLVILLFMFKNLAIPVVLILAIQGGIWLNFVIPFLSATPISFIGYLIISATQMGATIDYAIVLTNRYLTTRHNYTDRLQAMAEAENHVFPTIITSGTILTVTGFALSIACSGVVASMGMLLGIGTLFSMFIVLFVLPSLLLVFEKLYDKCNFARVFGKLKRKPQPESANINKDVFEEVTADTIIPQETAPEKEYTSENTVEEREDKDTPHEDVGE